MADDQIRNAVELAKAGRKSEARQIAAAILRGDKDNVAAWVVMAQVVADRAQAIDCLENVLRLEPDHPWATLHLNRLQAAEKAAEDATRATVVSQRAQRTPPPEDDFMPASDAGSWGDTAIDAPLPDLDDFMSAPAGSMAVPDELDPLVGMAGPAPTVRAQKVAKPRRLPWLIFALVFVCLLVIAAAVGAYFMGLLPFSP